MRTKIFPRFGLILFLIIAAFIFGFGIVRAALPVEAGLGQACTRSVNCVDVDENGIINEIDCGAPENAACSLCGENIQCSSPLRCGQSGKCVQCVDDLECDTSIDESCVNNVCTLPGGNNAGDLCTGDSSCKSGLKCGTRRICEEAGGGGFKKAFNYSCGSTLDCASGLSCSGGKCVQCATKNDCAGNVSACDQGVCVLTGGNPEGAWCTKGTQCVSGKCSDGNLCLAAEKGTGGGGGEWDWTGIDLSIQDVADIINGLACWLTRIATAIMVIFLVIAGMRFMYARGNPTAYQAAVKNFQHVLIGILVIMAVYVIIATVAHAVGRTDFSLIPLVC